MKKLLCLVLAAFMIFSLVGCTGNQVPSKSTTYTVPATVGAGDTALSDFFGGKVSEKLSGYAPVLFSFAIALNEYPEVLTQTPDSNFGWAYLYNMLAVYDLRPPGVTASEGTIIATLEAVNQLQFDTLGGKLWIAPGDDYVDRVTYSPVDQKFTCVDADDSNFACEITAASLNADTGCADITVTVTADGTTTGYIISMRADKDSAYSYVIATFAAA